jgi:hypothetical protein
MYTNPPPSADDPPVRKAKEKVPAKAKKSKKALKLTPVRTVMHELNPTQLNTQLRLTRKCKACTQACTLPPRPSPRTTSCRLRSS